MSVEISTAYLLSVERGELEPAELWDAIGEQQLTDWEAEWVPELFKALQRLRRVGVPRRFWPQSRHWDWRRKTESLQGLLAHPGFSLMCAGMTQGMMLIDVVSKRCRLKSQQGKNLVYVEYLENAPWNRKELLFDPPRYRGVGVLLMRAAIESSLEAGFKGRIGLHSLPQSNRFYANTCGMTDMGADADPQYHPMHYFEMTPEQAEVFIARGKRL